MNYLLIEGELLSNSSYTPTDKMLLQIIRNMDKVGKALWASPKWLGDELGLEEEFIRKRLGWLEVNKVIWKNERGYVLNNNWEQTKLQVIGKQKK